MDAIFQLMTDRLGSDGPFKKLYQILMATTTAQGVSEINLPILQQTHPHPAISGEAHPVAIITIGVAHRADEADGT